MNARTRTVVAISAVVLLVAVAAYAGVLALLIRDAPRKDPAVTAYAHGRTVTVEPFLYCSVTMADCRYGETVDLEVPPGYPLQLSLPPQIAEAPWLAQLIYERPDGEQVDRLVAHDDFGKDVLAVTLDSRPEPNLRLVGVELQLPILARDETGREFYVPHAAWSINTAPDERGQPAE
ncbi:DUF2771 domain-containing protein [Nocardia harenae]|uniref:DUF2771 domain-containing protein n=1 Tax=Nocardia harenae TaxID=358707 RepID=UPI000836A8A6|nr:DUF2771 domain-containing protein [Nocardia harenae]